jgi:RNA polymerase sigma-70 factor (ECF subfamily)
VRLYGRRHLQNDAAADDLAQDVLLLTIERLHAGEVRRPEDIGSFVLGTSRMMARAERRVERRRAALAARFIDTDARVAPSSTAALDTPRVAACLRALAERDRLVMLLTFYADREAPRIADDLGVSPGAVQRDPASSDGTSARLRAGRRNGVKPFRWIQGRAAMTAPGCGRVALADLTDYAAGELPESEAAAIEEHLFSCAECGARAAEFEALVRATRAAVRSAEVGGFVTDAVLNTLAREGVRVRSYALSPAAVVPCAVWDGDELMALRLRGDFGGVSEVTLSQRVAGTEVSRTTGQVAVSPHGEIIYAIPAAWVRELPVVDVEVLLTAHEGGQERPIGSYTLVHGGSLPR